MIDRYSTYRDAYYSDCDGRWVKYCDIKDLIETLKEYLALDSCDGRKDRMPLRAKLKEIII